MYIVLEEIRRCGVFTPYARNYCSNGLFLRLALLVDGKAIIII